MADKVEVKGDGLPDLDDLLQCPVCYEIPTGQIFQCNEGHHVCGRCKARLDVCPVCRALFFGTRNYAMEELIANIRRLRAFKLGGKVTTGTVSSESSTPAREKTPLLQSASENGEEVDSDQLTDQSTSSRPPQACKGLFRCLCCKNGKASRLPIARLLNHLRYYHSPDLIEGQSENGEYVQAWQFSTDPGRLVTAVRVSDMGIFFLIIEINNGSLCAWLSMAASPWVAHEFSYTVTISGNDREAIFSDYVWSVRSCEGSLKKRGHSLVVNGVDARALISPEAINSKLIIKRTPGENLAHLAPPRAVVRVASRGTTHDPRQVQPRPRDLEPFLHDLQNDVARLSRAFATLGREANAIRTEAEMRSRLDVPRQNVVPPAAVASPPPPAEAQPQRPVEGVPMSRNARRRMRQRLRAALAHDDVSPHVHHVGFLMVQEESGPSAAVLPAAPAPAPAPVPAPSSAPGPRRNKKRRQRR